MAKRSATARWVLRVIGFAAGNPAFAGPSYAMQMKAAGRSGLATAQNPLAAVLVPSAGNALIGLLGLWASSKLGDSGVRDLAQGSAAAFLANGIVNGIALSRVDVPMFYAETFGEPLPDASEQRLAELPMLPRPDDQGGMSGNIELERILGSI